MRAYLTTLPVIVGAFAPMLAFALAVAIDRKRRIRLEKPPQQEKLLRPAGYSLSMRLDATLDGVLTDIL